MPALYFFRRDNDDDDNNVWKALSANNDDYHSYKQISVVGLKKISGGSLNHSLPLAESQSSYTHSKVRSHATFDRTKPAHAITKKNVSAGWIKFLSKVARATPRKWKCVHANFCYNWFDGFHVTQFFLVNSFLVRVIVNRGARRPTCPSSSRGGQMGEKSLYLGFG